MAISQQRYVQITSGVGGNNNIRQRDLILRLFTTNPLVATKTIVEFTSAADVATYFGTTSAEYLRALFYFSFVSKNIKSPTKISFARWTDTAAAARIYGATGTQAVSSYNSITAGAFTLTMGGATYTLTGLNFSTAASLSDVAAILQTAIRAKTGGGAAWTGATVTYDPVRKSFNLLGGSTGTSVITVAAGTGGADVAGQIGWLTGTGLIVSNGNDAESLTTTLNLSNGLSNNFGSFLFMPYLTPAQNLEVATWNNSQNNLFMFCLWTNAADAAANSTNTLQLAGQSITLSPLATEYPEQIPAMVLASTDFTKRNSVQNYMFQQAPLTPSVLNNADADLYDPQRVNYYGRTQQAGQLIDFYQRGTMTGLATAPTDMNTYANEMWFKDIAAAAILTLLLSLGKVSANTGGRALLIATMVAGPVAQALLNGTISVGNDFLPVQKLYIGQLTGDDLAWNQVQNIGWWLDVNFSTTVTTDGRIEYLANYVFIYAKDNDIRKVVGTDVLV